jgi:hypothetical protein
LLTDEVCKDGTSAGIPAMRDFRRRKQLVLRRPNGSALQEWRHAFAGRVTISMPWAALTPELTSAEAVRSGLTQAEACGLHPAHSQLE